MTVLTKKERQLATEAANTIAQAHTRAYTRTCTHTHAHRRKVSLIKPVFLSHRCVRARPLQFTNYQAAAICEVCDAEGYEVARYGAEKCPCGRWFTYVGPELLYPMRRTEYNMPIRIPILKVKQAWTRFGKATRVD